MTSEKRVTASILQAERLTRVDVTKYSVQTLSRKSDFQILIPTEV